MNKKLSNRVRVLMAVGAVGAMSITAIAAPILKEVNATLKSDMKYVINGEAALAGTDALVYDNTTYLPVRKIAEALDAKVEYKDGIIAITTGTGANTRTVEVPVTEVTEENNKMEAVEAVTIESATIKSIDLESKQVTILPDGQKDEATSYIVLNMGEDTSITHFKARRLFALEDLKEGMKVSVTHSPMMTRSMPPQTPAFNVTILDELSTFTDAPAEEVAPLENVVLKDVVIAEISEDGKTITVGKTIDPQDLANQTILHITEDTVIKHHKNKKAYTAADLEKGQKLEVTHSPIMALSFPGQTTAFEIVIMD
ncbi:MAG: stalk domain-containing protein [Cellulosilyticaceae bacterium]